MEIIDFICIAIVLCMCVIVNLSSNREVKYTALIIEIVFVIISFFI